MRIAPEKVCQVVSLLIEGVGIRAIQRLTGLNRRTVLSVLEQAGRHCEALMFRKVCNLTVENVAVDELWAFIYCKEANRDEFAHNHGDQYTYLAIETKSKLIITYLVGKRTKDNAIAFMEDLKSKVVNRFQLSTDGFIGYISHERKKGAVEMAFGNQIDYGTEIKKYAVDVNHERRYSAPLLQSIRRKRRPPNLVMPFQSLEDNGLQNKEIVPESRLQRALEKLHSETLVHQELKPKRLSETQDEYNAPYPFATLRDYRLALSQECRALIETVRKAVKTSHH